ncbi:MAG: hypothetical protein Q8Q62_12225 [Mesorhizobium sp.]|nr:hypothetical protein [Mesorhizobium sp.]
MTLASVRRIFRLACIAGAVALPAGCQSANLNDIAPLGVEGGSARVTGTFPNLNNVPTPATEQITPTEKQAKIAELKAAQAAQKTKGGGSAQASAAALRKIGKGQEKTLSDIETE